MEAPILSIARQERRTGLPSARVFRKLDGETLELTPYHGSSFAPCTVFSWEKMACRGPPVDHELQCPIVPTGTIQDSHTKVQKLSTKSPLCGLSTE